MNKGKAAARRWGREKERLEEAREDSSAIGGDEFPKFDSFKLANLARTD